MNKIWQEKLFFLFMFKREKGKYIDDDRRTNHCNTKLNTDDALAIDPYKTITQKRSWMRFNDVRLKNDI